MRSSETTAGSLSGSRNSAFPGESSDEVAVPANMTIAGAEVAIWDAGMKVTGASSWIVGQQRSNGTAYRQAIGAAIARNTGASTIVLPQGLREQQALNSIQDTIAQQERALAAAR